jgi:suppressor of ftsI
VKLVDVTGTPHKEGTNMASSRRTFLASAGRAWTALASASLFNVGSAQRAAAQSGHMMHPAPGPQSRLGPELTQPEQIRSTGGVLKAQLTAAPGTIRLGSVDLPGFMYNSSYIPPVLRVGKGDVIQVTLKNNLPDETTNLHFHGMAVSPKGNSDNVFLQLDPGQTLDYHVEIPAKGQQAEGLYWYHPHMHGEVTAQILGGMSGALVVEGIDQYWPIVKNATEKFPLIKHVEPPDGEEVISINGQVNPTISVASAVLADRTYRRVIVPPAGIWRNAALRHRHRRPSARHLQVGDRTLPWPWRAG